MAGRVQVEWPWQHSDDHSVQAIADGGITRAGKREAKRSYFVIEDMLLATFYIHDTANTNAA